MHDATVKGMQKMRAETAMLVYGHNAKTLYALKRVRTKRNELMQGEELEDGKYPGVRGLHWIKSHMRLPNLPLFTFNATSYGIVQYCDPLSVGKIVENCTCVDIDGAYITALCGPIPYEYRGTQKPKEEYAILYVSTVTRKCQWMRPSVETNFEEHYFVLKTAPGADLLMASYRSASVRDPKMIAVAGIGMLSRSSIVAQYIWYRTGQRILSDMEYLRMMGCKIIKAHTDSITFVRGNLPLTPRPGYKVEYRNKDVYIVHQGCYQVKGSRPQGLYVTPDPDIIEYEDGVKIKLTKFPCLRIGKKYKCIVSGVEGWRALGERHGVY